MARHRAKQAATDGRKDTSSSEKTKRGDDPAPPKDGTGWSISAVVAVLLASLTGALIFADVIGATESSLFLILTGVAGVLAALFGLHNQVGKVSRRRFAGYVAATALLGVALVTLLVATHNPAFARMSGDFNVAVASIAATDEMPGSEESARSLSESLYRRLDSDLTFSTGDAPFAVDVLGPDGVPSVEGGSPEDRAAEAASAADRLGADLVVFGQIEVEGGRTVVRPEFFISGRYLLGAEEFAGHHELGEPLAVPGDLGRDLRALGEVREALIARAQALADFVGGLADYKAGDYAAAGERFRAALETGSLGAGRGREVGLLFIGNTALQQGDLRVAQQAYEDALEANPRSARAYLGLGEVAYARAAHLCGPGADQDGLRRAADLFGAAERTPEPPPLALVGTKARLGAGRAYNCLALAGDDEAVDLALGKLTAVTTEYRRRDDSTSVPQFREIAALATAELALAHTQRGAPAGYGRAAALYQEAADLTEVPARAAGWYGDMAFSLAHGGRCPEAEEAADRAAALDRAVGRRLAEVRALCSQAGQG